MLQLFASRVDAEGLGAIANAFGQEETAAAVSRYSPSAIAKQFAKTPTKIAVEPSVRVSEALQTNRVAIIGTSPDAGTGGGGSPGPKGPNVGMTPYEIYLEFRTAPGGSGSILVALYEAAMFMGGKTTLGGAASTGAVIGTAVSQLIQTYDPSLNDAIGGTISNMIDQMSAAETALALGQIQSAWDSLFAIPNVATPGTVPIPPTPGSVGDFGVTTALAVFTGAAGSALPSNASGGAADQIVDGVGC